MSAQPKLNLTDVELNDMVAQAKRRGFADLTSYVLQLVKADAKERGEAFPNAEAVQEDEGNPLEDFRAAWEEIRRGETLSLDEFLKAVLTQQNYTILDRRLFRSDDPFV